MFTIITRCLFLFVQVFFKFLIIKKIREDSLTCNVISAFPLKIFAIMYKCNDDFDSLNLQLFSFDKLGLLRRDR